MRVAYNHPSIRALLLFLSHSFFILSILATAPLADVALSSASLACT